MRSIRETRGLKFPDDYVTRWFFKRGLDRRPGRMLELGCAGGANLMLAQAYGWAPTGVDLDRRALADAGFNLGGDARLIEADLARGWPGEAGGPFDAAMIPNLLCYLTDPQLKSVLDGLRQNLGSEAEVFVRTRTTSDYRYGRGQAVGADAFVLDTEETGEAGLINRFWGPEDLAALLVQQLGLRDPVVLRVDFENLQAGRIVTNADVVIWGACP